jgi:Cu-Zn family superoxide dismutase
MHRLALLLGLGLALALGGAPAAAQERFLSAPLVDRQGREIGLVWVEATDAGTRVNVAASGLTPGRYAARLHAAGRCEPPAFATAGGVLAALPDLTADEDGKVHAATTVAQVTLGPGPAYLLDADGSAFVIARGAAEASERLACAILARPAGGSGSRPPAAPPRAGAGGMRSSWSAGWALLLALGGGAACHAWRRRRGTRAWRHGRAGRDR